MTYLPSQMDEGNTLFYWYDLIFVMSYRVHQYLRVCVSGDRILAATERLQLWAPPNTDVLIEEEDGQLNDDRAHELILNDWKCVWQCKSVIKPSA